MKKISCSLIALLATTVAFAADTPIHLLSYTTSNNEVTITGADATVTDLRIPATIGGNPVTTIGNNAFDGSTITNATLPPLCNSLQQPH